MDSVETELHEAAKAVLVALRTGEGVKSILSDRLKRALQAAAQEWASSTVISKSAATCLST
jgi:hypothetical protein